MEKIKNLALKGGGVKGIAYVGALYELDDRGHFETIEHVSGTSAGAIVALMVALQLSPKKIEDLMKGLNFNDFKKGCSPIRLFTKYGLYSGDEILKFIHICYKESPLNLPLEDDDHKITFADFRTAGGKDLIVFASNLNTKSIEEFSLFKTPNCIVSEAVRASMSIPFFFKSWKFTNGIPNDHIYVDGGVVFNYPLSFFDRSRFHNNPKMINMETLGLFLEPKKIHEYEKSLGNLSGNNPSDQPNIPALESLGVKNRNKWYKKIYIKKFKYFMSIIKYVKHLFDTLMSSQNIELFEDSHLVLRTIFIDDLGISATKFNLSDSEKEKLVESGREGAKSYFNYIEEQNKTANNTSK